MLSELNKITVFTVSLLETEAVIMELKTPVKSTVESYWQLGTWVILMQESSLGGSRRIYLKLEQPIKL